LELITNTKELNHKSALTDLIDWADSCLFCTSFFDKKGLEHLLPKLLSGISDRGMKVKIFSNGEKEYTKPHIIAKLKNIRNRTYCCDKERQAPSFKDIPF
jgi:HKD family nuclease